MKKSYEYFDDEGNLADEICDKLEATGQLEGAEAAAVVAAWLGNQTKTESGLSLCKRISLEDHFEIVIKEKSPQF